MIRQELEISEVSVVVLGQFNPDFFRPEWFVSKAMLPKNVVGSADVEIISPLLTRFRTDWLHFHADPVRFEACTSQFPCVRIRDFVMRTFHENLADTSINAIGINRDVHFCVSSDAQRRKFGRLIAPVEPWKSIAKRSDLSASQNRLASLTMKYPLLENGSTPCQLNVMIEPSELVDSGHSGIRVHVNEHFETSENEASQFKLLDCLESQFDSAVTRADDIVEHVMALAEEA